MPVRRPPDCDHGQGHEYTHAGGPQKASRAPFDPPPNDRPRRRRSPRASADARADRTSPAYATRTGEHGEAREADAPTNEPDRNQGSSGRRAREPGSGGAGAGAGRAEEIEGNLPGAAEEGGRADHRRGRGRVFRAPRAGDPAAHDRVGAREGSVTVAGSAQKPGRPARPDIADELTSSGSRVDFDTVGECIPIDASHSSDRTRDLHPPLPNRSRETALVRRDRVSHRALRDDNRPKTQPKTRRPSLSKRPENGSLSAEAPCFRAHRAILRTNPPRRSARKPLDRHRNPVENRVERVDLSAQWRE